MKKKQFIPIFLLGLLYLPLVVNAQLNISGNLGLHYLELEKDQMLYYSVTPKFGYEINDNIVIGGLIGYTGLSIKQSGFYYDKDESFGVVNFGIYGRFNTTKSDKIRLIIEPTLAMGIENEDSDLMISFATVPVIQLRITEKVYFDMTLGLMGLSIFAVPGIDFWEFNFGLYNESLLYDFGLSSYTSSTLTPLQLGLTFSL